jgi:sugar-phosphatase
MGPLAGRRFAAVIFDMDGTLVDSTAAVLRCWVRWAQDEGVDPVRMAHSHGVPAEEIVARLLPPERRAAALRRITDLELADTHDITVLPGAAEALLAVPRDRSAIATSCTRPLAEARIAASGLVRPDVVVTVDDVAVGKPAPDPFLRAAELLAVDPRSCLVVEDAPSGITAAQAAGCATLAVTTTTPAERLEADLVVPGLADVRWETADGGIRLHVSSDGPADEACSSLH